MDPDPARINYVQIMTFVFSILIMYEQYKLYKLDPNNWKKTLNACLYAIHIFLFYSFLFVDSIELLNVHEHNKLFFTNWSPFVRLHSVVAFYFVMRSSHTFVLINNKTRDLLRHYTVEKSENKT